MDTLVGFEVDPRRIGLPSKRALSGTGLVDLGPIGPNPFGPATAEFDLTPFLGRASLSLARGSTAIAVVLVCLLAGVATAVSLFSDDAVAKRETHKSALSPRTPPAAGADLPAASAAVLEPRLADLYGAPEASTPEPATSEPATSEADTRRARRRRARARRRILRRRRAARRRARSRARR